MRRPRCQPSEQSSAALARRILQRVLVDCGGADAKKRLDRQIDDVAPSLPSYISENLHFLRGVGNFAAHAQQDSAGTIIKVDREEAEATLDVIDSLFEHYYVAQPKPARPGRSSRRKRSSLQVTSIWRGKLISKSEVRTSPTGVVAEQRVLTRCRRMSQIATDP